MERFHSTRLQQTPNLAPKIISYKEQLEDTLDFINGIIKNDPVDLEVAMECLHFLNDLQQTLIDNNMKLEEFLIFSEREKENFLYQNTFSSNQNKQVISDKIDKKFSELIEHLDFMKTLQEKIDTLKTPQVQTTIFQKVAKLLKNTKIHI